MLFTLDNNKPLTEVKRQRILNTLHGMEHTIEALTMIINRSVDASISAAGSHYGISPNRVPVQLEKVMDEIEAFCKWQADGSGIEVVMEPLPDDLPDEIMTDEKWLKDDLLCLAGNCVKYSRSNQQTPAVMRVAIVPSPIDGKAISNTNTTNTLSSSSSVQFTFIDSGYPLAEERLKNLFNRPVHSERMDIGGMGLGLFCLRQHIEATQVTSSSGRNNQARNSDLLLFNHCNLNKQHLSC